MSLDTCIYPDRTTQKNFLEDYAYSVCQCILQYNNIRLYHTRAESEVETLTRGNKLIIFTELITLAKFLKN